MMKNSKYSEVLKQRSYRDVEALLKRWDVLSANMNSVPAGAPIILPDIFLLSQSGAGRTYFLNLLADFLTEKGNLIDFYGNVKYFEFMLNYCAPDAQFTEIQRLMHEVNNAGGFRSEYRGIIFIDIDEWRTHFEEKHFISFLEYLSDNSDDWLVVLSLSDKAEEDTVCAESVISSFLRAERVRIDAPTASELLSYVEKKLQLYGLSLKLEAKEVIFDSITAILKNKYFDGYKTVKMFARDIAYQTYSSSNCSTELSAADVDVFKADGEYICKMMMKIANSQKIGF